MEHDENFHIFFQAGEVLPLGATVYRHDYARALELIAEGGADAFYTGDLAEAVVRAVRDNGGLMTLDDLRGGRIC